MSRSSHVFSMYQIKARFLTLWKGADANNAHFTMSALPQPLHIPCESAPHFSDFQEVTNTNTNLLVEMTNAFPHDLIKTGKKGALTVCLSVCLPIKHTKNKQYKKSMQRISLVFNIPSRHALSPESKKNLFSRFLFFRTPLYRLIKQSNTHSLTPQ